MNTLSLKSFAPAIHSHLMEAARRKFDCVLIAVTEIQQSKRLSL
jgi:hypothetical protein